MTDNHRMLHRTSLQKKISQASREPLLIWRQKSTKAEATHAR
jgi:hypothetical protein